MRKSQPITTRPISEKASVALAAMLSAWDSDGCDDSVVWTDMVFPLDASLAVLFFSVSTSIGSRSKNDALHDESLDQLTDRSERCIEACAARLHALCAAHVGGRPTWNYCAVRDRRDCLQFSSDRAVERPNAAAADQEE